MSIETSERLPSLEEQFENSEVIELAGGSVELIDVVPERVKTEVPTVVAPGWAVTSGTFKDNILELAGCGRRVISVNAPHGVETGQHADDIPDAELRKAAALLGALEEKGVDRVDVVAHSEGGLYVALAASLSPERFRNLVLVDPVGLIEDTPRRLMTEFSREIVWQVVRGIKERKLIKPMVRSFGYAAKSVAQNPMQSFRQFLAMSNADIKSLLQELRGRGVGISVVHAVDDKTFPMERVQEIVDMSHLDGFYSIHGGHNEIFLRAKELASLADNALDALERRGSSSSL